MAVLNTLGLLVTLATVARFTSGYKVLFIPSPANSHIVLLSSAAEAWVKAGHEAHVIKHHSVPVPSQFQNSGIHYFPFGKPGEVHISMTKEFTETIGHMSQKSFLEVVTFMMSIFEKFCDGYLDEELYEALKKEKYDFVVVDIMPGKECLNAIPHRLGVPYGSLGVLIPFDMLSETLQISYLGTAMPFFYSKEPSFLRRFGQFVLVQMIRIVSIFTQNNDKIHHYIRDKPVRDLAELKMANKIWLIDMEPLVEAPLQAPPNLVYVGGMSVTPVKPLPDELKKFADSAKEGLVVVSFGGSLTTDFPDEMLKKLLVGLSSIKYKVVIRLKAKPNYEIGKNIFITKWLPQNDLLGHPNTVLFITHCGASSVNEAVHQGVPMLGFPNQDEQNFNAIRFSDKNYGLKMDRNNFTSEELKNTVDRMMSDPTYKNAIKKASAIIKGRRTTPGEEAVYWINHVIKYGGDHLIPATRNLAWYEVMMYDIAAALLLITAVVLFVLAKFCKCLGRICCGIGKGKAKKQKKS